MRANALIAFAATLEALALDLLPDAATLDALTTIFQHLTGHRVTVGLEHGAIALEALAAAHVPLSARLDTIATRLLPFPLDLLTNAARFRAGASALDRLAGASLDGGLRMRLRCKDEDRTA